MEPKIDPKTTGFIVGGIAVALVVIVIAALNIHSGLEVSPNVANNQSNGPRLAGEAPNNETIPEAKDKITKFDSEEDFKDYLDKAEKSGGMPFFGFVRGGGLMASDSAVTQSKTMGLANEFASAPASSPTPGRVSTTNVQVLGIDEPDVVKTDGKQIFYSPEQRFFRPMMERPLPMPVGVTEDKISYPYPPDYTQTPGVEVINAFPPDGLKLSAKLDKNGDLLLYKDTLIVFSRTDNKVYGYDVSNPAEPKQKWDAEIKENDTLEGVRLYQDQIYIATRSFIAPGHPCPIEPFVVGGSPVKFECGQIYHPDQVVPVDLTYNLLVLDPAKGEVKKTASFVGSSSASVLYMSDRAIYVAYDYPGNFVKLFADFLGINSDIVPASISDKIKKVE